MNTLFAASLFDSPWVILVFVLVGALSNWLMKRRQRNQQGSRPEGDEPLPPPGKPQEGSPRELDLQEVLRQLLGGEPPPPRVPQPPPIPPVLRDARLSEVSSDEGQFQREPALSDEARETVEAVRPYPAPLRSNATRVEPGEQLEQLARHFEQLNVTGRRPATLGNTGHKQRSRERTRAVALVRDAGTVRQAFVASLVFGPPKAFES